MTIKKKYKQLFLSLHFGSIGTMNIRGRWQQGEERPEQ